MFLDGPTCIIRKTYLRMIINLTSPEYLLSTMGIIHSKRRKKQSILKKFTYDVIYSKKVPK